MEKETTKPKKIDLRDRTFWRKKKKVTSMNLFTRQELLHKINNFKTYDTIRDRALISFLYLTGCRVNEAVKKITPLQIKFEEYKGEIFIVIQNMECLKRRADNKAWRDVPISAEKDNEFYNYPVIPAVCMQVVTDNLPLDS